MALVSQDNNILAGFSQILAESQFSLSRWLNRAIYSRQGFSQRFHEIILAGFSQILAAFFQIPVFWLNQALIILAGFSHILASSSTPILAPAPPFYKGASAMGREDLKSYIFPASF